jgi:hypothetical protein
MFTVIETPYFSKLWPRYWYEEERGAFAAYLADHPEVGDVVPGTGGLRKIRWSRAGSGKSVGVRVIYFNRFVTGEIILIVMYAKSERGNLSAKQLLEIRNVIEE